MTKITQRGQYNRPELQGTSKLHATRAFVTRRGVPITGILPATRGRWGRLAK